MALKLKLFLTTGVTIDLETDYLYFKKEESDEYDEIEFCEETDDHYCEETNKLIDLIVSGSSKQIEFSKTDSTKLFILTSFIAGFEVIHQ